jgi:hypothetical protein
MGGSARRGLSLYPLRFFRQIIRNPLKTPYPTPLRLDPLGLAGTSGRKHAGGYRQVSNGGAQAAPEGTARGTTR